MVTPPRYNEQTSKKSERCTKGQENAYWDLYGLRKEKFKGYRGGILDGENGDRTNPNAQK